MEKLKSSIKFNFGKLSSLYGEMELRSVAEPYTNTSTGEITTTVKVLCDGMDEFLDIRVKGAVLAMDYPRGTIVDFEDVVMTVSAAGRVSFGNVSSWLNCSIVADGIVKANKDLHTAIDGSVKVDNKK